MREKNDIKVCHMTSAHEQSDIRIFEKECVSLSQDGYQVYFVAPGESGINKDVICVGCGESSKRRFSRMTKMTKMVYKNALKIDADIYHFHDPELLPYALKLKKKGKKVLYDVHEDYPVNIMEKKWIPFILRQPIAKIWKVYEAHASIKFDGIISVTPQIIKRFCTCGAKTKLISNYPILEKGCDRQQTDKRKFCLCFAGVIAADRMHHNIIKAIASLEDIEYCIAGPVPYPQYWEELSQLAGYEKVVYQGILSRLQVQEFYHKADVGIVLENYSPINYGKEGSLGVTKLFEFMQAGLPVICSDFEIWKDIVENYSCGMTVNPNDVEQIADTIRNLKANHSLRTSMGINGEEAVRKKYNWKSEECKLLEFYKEILKSGSKAF